jgi:quercetin dioxygenase-like cupin family protein
MAILALVASATLAAGAAQAALAPKALTVIPFDTLQFKGAPGGPQTAILYGDPKQAGPYGIVVKWLPHTNSRPHSHPYDRYITVLSGTWWVNTGPRFNAETMVPIKPGAFVIHTANQIHYDGAKDETALIYITGMGPAPTIDREEK